MIINRLLATDKPRLLSLFHLNKTLLAKNHVRKIGMLKLNHHNINANLIAKNYRINLKLNDPISNTALYLR